MERAMMKKKVIKVTKQCLLKDRQMERKDQLKGGKKLLLREETK
jgi:hypothetical protein